MLGALWEQHAHRPYGIRRPMTGKAFSDIARLRVGITGATRGIGRALALAFGEQGARVLLHGRDPSALSTVADGARSRGASSTHMVTGDLRDPELPERLAAHGAEAMGGLDVLFLSAGILGPMGPLTSLGSDTFRDVLDVDVVAQHALVRAVLPGMIAQGQGALIWMSTGLGRFGIEGYGPYCAAKHAVEGLMKVAHAEHGENGIVSVAVAPGLVQTDMLRAALGTDDVSEHRNPDDVAGAFVRLVADLDSDHGGASLDIDPWLAS